MGETPAAFATSLIVGSLLCGFTQERPCKQNINTRYKSLRIFVYIFVTFVMLTLNFAPARGISCSDFAKLLDISVTGGQPFELSLSPASNLS
jgi:hypothetical protein